MASLGSFVLLHLCSIAGLCLLSALGTKAVAEAVLCPQPV